MCFFSSTESPQALDSSKEQRAPSESVHTESSLPHTDSGIGEEQGANLLNGGSDSDHSVGGLISTLSSEVKRSQESLSESPSMEVLKSSSSSSSVISISQPKRGINVKEILKSLVAAPVEGVDLESVSSPDPSAKAQPHTMLPMQFHSFDR